MPTYTMSSRADGIEHSRLNIFYVHNIFPSVITGRLSMIFFENHPKDEDSQKDFLYG